MKANESGIDRAIRMALAAVLVVLALTGVLGGSLALIGYILAAILAVTALVGFCPLYALLGWNTRKA